MLVVDCIVLMTIQGRPFIILDLLDGPVLCDGIGHILNIGYSVLHHTAFVAEAILLLSDFFQSLVCFSSGSVIVFILVVIGIILGKPFVYIQLSALFRTVIIVLIFLAVIGGQ